MQSKPIYKIGDLVPIPNLPAKTSFNPDDMGFWGIDSEHEVGKRARVENITNYTICNKPESPRRDRMYQLKYNGSKHWYRETVLLQSVEPQMAFTFYEEKI